MCIWYFFQAISPWVNLTITGVDRVETLGLDALSQAWQEYTAKTALMYSGEFSWLFHFFLENCDTLVLWAVCFPLFTEPESIDWCRFFIIWVPPAARVWATAERTSHPTKLRGLMNTKEEEEVVGQKGQLKQCGSGGGEDRENMPYWVSTMGRAWL